MLFLIVVGLFVMARTLWGWDMPVTRVSYLPKKRARIITLCCMPVFIFALADGQQVFLAVACGLYLLLFGLVGIILSKKKNA